MLIQWCKQFCAYPNHFREVAPVSYDLRVEAYSLLYGQECNLGLVVDMFRRENTLAKEGVGYLRKGLDNSLDDFGSERSGWPQFDGNGEHECLQKLYMML